ncbi:helix-turn-helix transcriptional regulator [Lysinibacillus sp. FSL K6-0075]|uniref:helix-turn-helix transcriptional regulator n=1 Tax=Lysinibacillus sp. FSL K6-0075 TaxID=2921415 RepID=UPI00315977FC
MINREWLKVLRKNAKLSQKQVAFKVGISPSAYAMYEQGRRTPDVATAAKIGLILKFEWQHFFETQLHETCHKIS